MAAIAELHKQTFEEVTAPDTWRPLVMAMPETVYEQAPRMRAAQFIGAAATSVEVGREHVSETSTYSLMHAVHEAARGSEEARSMVRRNVATDVVERTIKSGHITRVELSVDDQGRVMQHGQSAIDIQRNSLRYAAHSPQMRRRVEAEARNMFRIEEAFRHGLLEDYVFVVFSRAPDDMSEEQAAKTGFFTDTMSCAIQVTSYDKGALTVESAFVAGKTAWDKSRHDAETVGRIGDLLGVNLRDKGATELLDFPLLVHKSLLENGVVDLVQLYDHSAGNTFFGEAKQQQDYLAYVQACREREATFDTRVNTIVRRLIAEAHQLRTPQAASRRLSKLSGEEMLEQSIVDTSIDPRVFGIDAAWRIEHARYLVEAGQMDTVRSVIDEAKLLERSSSCPSGAGGAAGSEGDKSDSTNSGELDDCEFVSKECPKCHKKNVKTVVKKGRYHGACGCKS